EQAIAAHLHEVLPDASCSVSREPCHDRRGWDTRRPCRGERQERIAHIVQTATAHGYGRGPVRMNDVELDTVLMLNDVPGHKITILVCPAAAQGSHRRMLCVQVLVIVVDDERSTRVKTIDDLQLRLDDLL